MLSNNVKQCEALKEHGAVLKLVHLTIQNVNAEFSIFKSTWKRNLEEERFSFIRSF